MDTKPSLPSFGRNGMRCVGGSIRKHGGKDDLGDSEDNSHHRHSGGSGCGFFRGVCCDTRGLEDKEEAEVWAIRNKRTDYWVYGTDYRYSPPHQRTSFGRALTYETKKDAEFDFRHRKCGKEYEIVPVRLEALR